MNRRLARRGLLGAASLGLIALMTLAPAGTAFAHGERSQEAFLRTRTASWVDVKFSKTQVQQGEQMNITGSFYILQAFPEGIVPPEKAYLNVNAPGAVVTISDRKIGGEDQTQTVRLERGSLYDFKLGITGRREGRWHIHPAVSVKQSGQLVGPGQFLTVVANPDGYSNPVKLANGSTVNLENFGFWGVMLWQVVLLLVGAVWLIIWLVPNPIIGRAKVVGEGRGDELITPGQKKASVVMFAFCLLFAFLGPIIAKINNPDTLPPQIRRDFPPVSANQTVLLEVGKMRHVFYDHDAASMVGEFTVKNVTDRPVTLARYSTANLLWDNQSISQGDLPPFHYPLTVEPNGGTVGPGETAKLTITMADPAWEFQRVISTSEVSARIGSVLMFTDGQGGRQVYENDSEILPKPGTGVHKNSL